MHETKVDLSSTWLITVWYCGQENELATCYNMKPRKNKIHEHRKPIIATSMVISSLCRCLWSKRADLINGPAIENYIELGMNVKHCCMLLFSLIWRCRAVQQFILQLTFQWPGQGEKEETCPYPDTDKLLYGMMEKETPKEKFWVDLGFERLNQRVWTVTEKTCVC